MLIREMPGIYAAGKVTRSKLIEKKKKAKFPLSAIEVLVLGLYSSEMLASDELGDDDNKNISRIDDDDVEYVMR